MMRSEENKENNEFESDSELCEVNMDSPITNVTNQFDSFEFNSRNSKRNLHIDVPLTPTPAARLGKGKPPLTKSSRHNINNGNLGCSKRLDFEKHGPVSDKENIFSPRPSISSPRTITTSSNSLSRSPSSSPSPSPPVALPPAPPPSPCQPSELLTPSSPSFTRRCRSDMDIKGFTISRRSSIDLRSPNVGESKPISKIRRTSVCETLIPTSQESSVSVDTENKQPPFSSNVDCGEVPFFVGSDPNMKRITHHTMVDLMTGKYSNKFDKVHIIDCRFEYEYLGGHIQGAVNIDSFEKLLQQFFADPVLGNKECVVFHCEFSSHRGPRMMKFMREYDRQLNELNYPNLFYPNIYVLHEGYKNFFAHNKTKCEPMEYIPMKDPKYDTERKICVPRNQNQWKKNLMHRSKSFDG